MAYVSNDNTVVKNEYERYLLDGGGGSISIGIVYTLKMETVLTGADDTAFNSGADVEARIWVSQVGIHDFPVIGSIVV